jgi:hypothetical protein
MVSITYSNSGFCATFWRETDQFAPLYAQNCANMGIFPDLVRFKHNRSIPGGEECAKLPGF